MWWQILPPLGLVALFGYYGPNAVIWGMNWLDTGRFHRRDYMTVEKAKPAMRDEYMFGNFWVKCSLDHLPDAPEDKQA